MTGEITGGGQKTSLSDFLYATAETGAGLVTALTGVHIIEVGSTLLDKGMGVVIMATGFLALKHGSLELRRQREHDQEVPRGIRSE